MNILKGLDDHQVQPKNWPHYVSMSQCQDQFLQTSSIVSRDKDERHGVWIHVGLFQRRYNGTYTQGHGH